MPRLRIFCECGTELNVLPSGNAFDIRVTSCAKCIAAGILKVFSTPALMEQVQGCVDKETEGPKADA